MSPRQQASEPPALELRSVSKRFGDVVAVDNVHFTLTRGTVHALIGENGAGKSTLMRIADGLIPADAGVVRFFGAAPKAHDARGAARAGVGMVHQHLSLVPSLTVAENLVLGGSGLLRPVETSALLRTTMESSGLRVPEHVLAGDLSIVEQQRLEILKALARGARILILDEPTAVLAPADSDELLRWIRAFADRGGSVVLVTHKLREAIAVSDDVTVLRHGRVVRSGRAAESTEADLARAMFPDTLDRAVASTTPAAGSTIITAEAIVVVDAGGVQRIGGASFHIRRQEIVGIAAVEGSGHRELLRAIAGLVPVSSGAIQLPERVALIPADRLREALISEFTLTENVALHELGRRRGLMPWRELSGRTAALLDRFAIVAPSPSAPAWSLSGGNQQRLVVARELEHAVDLVVADNPTRGLDIRATAFVHDQLREAAARGAAVVFHSGDLDELLSLATRVLVVFHGTVSESGLDREAIGRAMVGAGSGDGAGSAA